MLLLKCNRFGFLHYVYPTYYFLIITIACYKLHFTICQFNCVCSPCLPWPLAAYTLKKRACTSTRKSKKVILRTELPSKHKAKNKTYSKLVIIHQSFTTWVFLETITLFGLLFFFFFFFGPCHANWGILVSWTGTEPRHQQWKHWVLITGHPGNSWKLIFLTDWQ